MNNELIIAILTFSIVMMVLNVVKDLLIKRYKTQIPESHISKSEKRWWIAYSIGILLLILLYGRAGP